MEVEIIIDIPQGSRNKYEMDHASGWIWLDWMLFTATRYPLDCGFIPGTMAEDGNPLDAMVLLGEPTFPGCAVTGRPVGCSGCATSMGLMPRSWPSRPATHAMRTSGELGDVPGHPCREIAQFFDIGKELEPGKGTDVRGWQDSAAAERGHRRRAGKGRRFGACRGADPFLSGWVGACRRHAGRG